MKYVAHIDIPIDVDNGEGWTWAMKLTAREMAWVYTASGN